MKNYIFLILTIIGLGTSKLKAQDPPLLGQIAYVPYNFVPRGWASCSGQLMSISQYSALFSLLGTTYGGNGQTTFALPDARGRVLLGEGMSNTGVYYQSGEKGGSENVTLMPAQMPAHNHNISATTLAGNQNVPSNAIHADTNAADPEYSSAVANTTMNPNMIAMTGGNQPHNNIQPYLVLKCIIAIQGVFPSRD